MSADEEERVRRRLGAFVGVSVWLGTLAGAIVLFTWLGQGSIGSPPIGEPATWVTWSRGAPPAHVVFALGRLLVLGLGWYLIGVTALGMVARITRSLRLVTIVEAVTVPGVRRLLRAAIGFGLVTAGVAPNVAGLVSPAYAVAPPHASPAADSVTQPPPDSPSSDPTRPPSDPTQPPPAEAPDPLWHLRIGSSGGVPATDAASVPPTGARPDPIEVVPPAPPAAGADAWEVRAGDHLWGIAEHVVSRHLGRPATEREVAGYWRRLIADNREALADPRDPDLIYPGQRFTLPAVVGP